MAVTISDKCVNCSGCQWECPTEAIRPGLHRPDVDGASCTECYGHFGEAQCIAACPVGAIEAVPEPIPALEERFRELYPGQPLVNTWVWQSPAPSLIVCPT